MEDWGQFVDIEKYQLQINNNYNNNYNNKLNAVFYNMIKFILIILLLYLLCKHIKNIL